MACPTRLNDVFPEQVGAVPMTYQGRPYHFFTTWTNESWFPWGSTATYAPDSSPIIDLTGTMLWVNAQMTVRCQKTYWVDTTGKPHYTADYIILQQSGYVRPRTVACGTGGGGSGPGINTFTDSGEYYSSAEWDPYDPYSSGGEGDCGSGSGSGPGDGGSGGGGDCHTEYVYIEVSYDGGATWSVWWEGDATVCG